MAPNVYGILDFFNMKTLLQLLLAQKLTSSKCVLFKNDLLPSDTVPLRGFMFSYMYTNNPVYIPHNVYEYMIFPHKIYRIKPDSKIGIFQI